MFRNAVLFMALVLAQVVCFAQKQPAAPITDDIITDQVMLKITSDPVVKGGALKVEVKDGVVTLSGDVEQAKQREKAEKLTRKVKGVKGVVNHLEIKARAAGK